MTDNELLLAISNIMEKKLDARIHPLESEIKIIKEVQARMQEDQTRMGEDLTRIREEQVRMQGIQARMQEDQTRMGEDLTRIKEDLTRIKEEQVRIREEQVKFREEQVRIREEQVSMKGEQAKMQEEQTKMSLVIENEIQPNVRFLAENYLPAAKKYEKESAKIEAMQMDIDIMKNVIRDHGEQLQKIS